MKNALLTTTLAVLTGFAANAQLNQKIPTSDKNSFKMDARHPYTKTNIHAHKGDTVFVSAVGQAYCNPSNIYTSFARSAGPEGISDYSKGVNYTIRDPRFGALVIGHASPQRHSQRYPYRPTTQGEVYACQQFGDLKKTPKGESFFIARSKDEIVLDMIDMFPQDNIGGFDVKLRVTPAAAPALKLK